MMFVFLRSREAVAHNPLRPRARPSFPAGARAFLIPNNG